jgi:3-phosphoshikimate 1-carboxyvinyltransferase
MTRKALEIFGCTCHDDTLTGGNPLHSPREITVEGDWSNGAFFLAANALGSDIAVTNLPESSSQGDKAVTQLLKKLKEHCVISAADIPDLIPILSVVAACSHGAVFSDIQRLRLKESDRVESVISMITAFGGSAEADETTLTIHGTGLNGGTVDCRNDHRIAMSAAIAATVCRENVTLLGAECVAKSYPDFFKIYRRLGGNYEQHLR